MAELDTTQIATWGAIALLAVPRLIEVVKWFVNREARRAEAEKQANADKMVGFEQRIDSLEKRVEQVREAGEKNHASLQRDFSELQKSNGGLLEAMRGLDTRIEKSSAATREAVQKEMDSLAVRISQLDTQMRQEITRAMREAINEAAATLKPRRRG